MEELREAEKPRLAERNPGLQQPGFGAVGYPQLSTNRTWVFHGCPQAAAEQFRQAWHHGQLCSVLGSQPGKQT